MEATPPHELVLDVGFRGLRLSGSCGFFEEFRGQGFGAQGCEFVVSGSGFGHATVGGQEGHG